MLKCKTFIPTLTKLTRTCRRVLSQSHATQTYLSIQTLFRSSGCFFFTIIARTRLLVQAEISFSLSWPLQTKPFGQTFSYHRHNPHKVTRPYKQTFTFLFCSLNRSTRPQGHLLLTEISHTGLLAHTDAFQPFLFTDVAHTGFLIYADTFYLLPRSTQANLSTRIFSFHRRSPHRFTRPHGCFLASPQPTRANLFTRTFSSLCCSLHRFT